MGGILSTYKPIICIESMTKFKKFLDIFTKKFQDTYIATDLFEFENMLPDDSNDTIVFIDSVFLSSISGDLDYILKIKNYPCIILFEENAVPFIRNSYIYDVLECKNPINIHNFLIKLQVDLDLRGQLQDLKAETTKVYDIGKKLSAEKDIKKLLELILGTSMDITSADAGTIYIVIDSKSSEWAVYEKSTQDRLLKFAITKNNSIEIDFQSTTSDITKHSIIGYTTLTGQPLRIEDAHKIPQDVDYNFNDNFDKMTGYNTKTLLTIPMCDHKDRVLGVIQLINKKEDGKIIPFSYKDEIIMYSLAGQAAVTIENSILYRKMEEFIKEHNLGESIDKYKEGLSI